MAGERVALITTRRVGENERRVFLRESEIRSLISTLSLPVVCHQSFTVKEENNVTYLGKGQAEEAAAYIRAFDPDEVVIDVFLSPRQEMNLERILGVPVSDREAVIESIFRINAHSREAKLQTEKAQALYLKPRLIFREANFSQQRGGVRGAKGEGEKALELARRNIDNRIKALDRELDEVRKQRETRRNLRKRTGIFSFALTGYTNAGKSTILNALAGAGVLSEDKLFATLDTTTRSLILPSGRKVLLSDTVGFIQNLPSLLVEAFSSTLEEALEADSIIVVADVSHPDATECFRTTMDTLESLGAGDKVDLVVINKCDDVYDDIALHYLESQGIRSIRTSMKEGKGISALLDAMDTIASAPLTTIRLLLPYSSPLFSSLSREGRVKSAEYGEEGITVEAEVPSSEKERYSEYILR